MFPDASGAIFTVLSLVALTIVGTYTAAYAAHVFFTIVVGTANGDEQLQWPDEPMLDWIGQSVHLFWLSAVWLLPVILAAQWILGPEGNVLSLAATVAALAWASTPVTLLSSLASKSRWVVVSPELLQRLMARSGSLIAFWLCSGPLLALAAVAAFIALRRHWGYMLPCTLALAAVWMVYARLLGRLAQIVSYDRYEPDRPRKKRRRPPRRSPTGAEVSDPWAEPEEDDPVERQPHELPPVITVDGPQVGYDLRPVGAGVEPQPAAARIIHHDEGDDVPYAVTAEAELPPLPRSVVEPSAQELYLARHRERPKPPESPWFDGIWLFPFRKVVNAAWVTLTALIAVTVVFVRLLMG